MTRLRARSAPGRPELWRRHEIGPMPAVAFAEAKPDPDQLGQRRAIPLAQPLGRAGAGGIAPISKCHTFDPADQLDLSWDRRGAAARLVATRRPGEHEPAAAQRDRDVCAAAVAETGREIV